MARDFARIWKGKDAIDIPSRLKELDAYTAKNPTIKSAFDMALYDLAAKAEGKPLYQFLGGKKRTIETDMTIGINTAEEMAASARKYLEEGASILKIKLGKNVKDDLERLQRIRQAVGPNMLLRVDVNQGWCYNDAVFALQGIRELGVEFCEQPMLTFYDDCLPELCRQSPVPIMADESCYNHHDARKLINSGSCHFINIKLAKSGGLAEAIRIQNTAENAGIPCMIGGMLESRLALTANLHLAYASPAIQFFDLDSCKIGQLEDPVTEGATYDGFFLNTPDLPGIGADVDETFLKKCKKWTF